MSTDKTADRLQTRETMLLNLMRRVPRCTYCGGVIYKSNCCCSQCGRVTILPEDIENERR